MRICSSASTSGLVMSVRSSMALMAVYSCWVCTEALANPCTRRSSRVITEASAELPSGAMRAATALASERNMEDMRVLFFNGSGMR